MKKILLIVLSVILCVGMISVFASCGGDSTDESKPANSTPNSTANSTEDSSSDSETKDSEKPDGGNTDNGNGGNEGGNSGGSTVKDPIPSNNKNALMIMSEELDGLFNPFYASSGPDNTIVGMTQISMLTSKYENGEVKVAYGDNEATVAKDFKFEYNKEKDETVYTFVLKNGIMFSDGVHPLTMNDVLFNLYVYLDPVYAGSSTMYSTKIKGLTSYRTQTNADEDSDADDQVTEQANSRANERINLLVNLFRSVGRTNQDGVYDASVAKMTEAINALTESEIGSGYKSAVTAKPGEMSHEQWVAQVLADYNNICKLYNEELGRAYDTALEGYTEAPYKGHDEFKNQLFCFMYSQGYVETIYVKVNGKDDKSQIDELIPKYSSAAVYDKQSAIDYAFNDTMSTALDAVLMYTASAQTVMNDYVSNAKAVILQEKVGDGGALEIPNISGIVSLGHTDKKGQTVTIGNNTYKIAENHNPDGTVSGEGYDVLQITINGVDPKAMWNFAFTVAPQYYYGEGSKVGVDIESNQFGVEWGSFEFMTKVIQSQRNVSVPVGAGAYKATDANDSNTPANNDFFKNNIVYFKKNDQFHTVGAGLNNAKIDKVRYQVVSASNAIPMIEGGYIHYATPQLTTQNFTKIEELAKRGASYSLTQQLGYGYIGVNASKVTDINLRKAIMCAMNTALALDYYRPGTAERIFWPMSKVSWAYPTGPDAEDNGLDYPQVGEAFSEEIARELIQSYMDAADYTASDLKITFTIAGSVLTEHPTYKVFRDAAALLNSMGWEIKVQADTQALTKLATGSLTVWAAAWGSTIDPDMYQVYHKDSTATSTLAWGYPSIKTNGSDDEKEILDYLSDLIEKARETDDVAQRKIYYQEAMTQVLELAIELPVYQRSTVYLYNSNVIDKNTLPKDINPYSSPLDRIWEIDFVK